MKILLRKGIFASLLLLLLFGCRQDDFHNTTENNNIRLVSDARSFFQKSNTKIAMLSYVSSYNWDGAIVSTGADGTYVEIPLEVTSKLGTVESSSGETFSAFHRLLMKQKDNGDFEIFYLVLASADKKFRNTDKRFNFYSISQRFSGQIIIIDSQNKKVFARYYDEGFRRPDNPHNNNDGTSNQAPDTVTCTYLGWAYEDGTFEPIMLMYCSGNEGDTGTPNYGNTGSGGGGTPGTKTPCEKTKTKIIGNPKVLEKIKDLKDFIKTGSGEKGWKFNKTGDPTVTANNAAHSVEFGDPSLLNGGYHNHTALGAQTFSSNDINTLLDIARYNGASDPTNAFLGVVIPGDMNYVIQFNGGMADLPAYGSFSPKQLKDLNQEQWKQYLELVTKPNMTMDKKIELMFFATLKKMGLQDKITLQKIDSNNKVYTVNKNPDGSTTAVPCY